MKFTLFMEFTIEEFVNHMKQRLEEFENYWNKNHQENPENYPLKMTDGEWDEQFASFE